MSPKSMDRKILTLTFWDLFFLRIFWCDNFLNEIGCKFFTKLKHEKFQQGSNMMIKIHNL
jgi:hypothetical protein